MHSYDQQDGKAIADGRNEGRGDISELYMEFCALKEKKAKLSFKAIILWIVSWNWEEGILFYSVQCCPPVTVSFYLFSFPLLLGRLWALWILGLCLWSSYTSGHFLACVVLSFPNPLTRLEVAWEQRLCYHSCWSTYPVCAWQLNISWITLIHMLNSSNSKRS